MVTVCARLKIKLNYNPNLLLDKMSFFAKLCSSCTSISKEEKSPLETQMESLILSQKSVENKVSCLVDKNMNEIKVELKTLSARIAELYDLVYDMKAKMDEPSKIAVASTAISNKIKETATITDKIKNKFKKKPVIVEMTREDLIDEMFAKVTFLCTKCSSKTKGGKQVRCNRRSHFNPSQEDLEKFISQIYLEENRYIVIKEEESSDSDTEDSSGSGDGRPGFRIREPYLTKIQRKIPDNHASELLK